MTPLVPLAIAIAAATLGLGPAGLARAETRVLAIGINRYPNVTPALQGAVDDAKDISDAFAKRGVKDIKTLVEQDATRKRVLAEIEGLIARTAKDDLVVVAFAGHGAREIWGKARPAGIEAGGKHGVLLLWNFALPNSKGLVDKTRGDAADRMSGTEMNLYLKRLSDKGARVLYVVDACFGGDAVRSVLKSPHIWPPAYRSVETVIYADGQDPLAEVYGKLPKPLDPGPDLPNVTFLASVSAQEKSPEYPVPAGSGKPRGVLSYAFARAIDGSAGVGDQGRIGRRALISYLKPAIAALSANGQNPEFEPLSDLDRTVIDASKDFGSSGGEGAPQPKPIEVVKTIKLAVFNAPAPAAGPSADGSYVIQPVSSAQEADLVFDAERREVTNQSDLVASEITAADLGGVLEREFAWRRLVSLANGRGLAMKLVGATGQPGKAGDRRYREGENIDLDGRDTLTDGKRPDEKLYHTLFNIAGDGTVQFLYPLPSDPVLMPQDHAFKDVWAKPPFGTDLFVLVTSPRPLDDLIRTVKGLDKTRKPLVAVKAVEAALGDGVRIGLQGFYTSKTGN